MNVFDAIKGTILNVPKDISSGIKSLTTRDSMPKSESPSRDDDSSSLTEINNHNLDLDAGGELLSKFQGHWSDMHQKAEESAKQAKKVDRDINELFLYLERQTAALNLFLMEISVLPQLLEDLKSVTNTLVTLEEQFENFESEFLVLEDVCEEQEYQHNKRHHEYQLGMYQQRRNAELEQAKVQMAKEHAGKVQKYERHLQKTLREKQQVFEASFKEEMQHYKKFGQFTNAFKSSPSPEKPKINIADFCPEEDDAELDTFLNIDNIGNTSVVQLDEARGKPTEEPCTPSEDQTYPKEGTSEIGAATSTSQVAAPDGGPPQPESTKSVSVKENNNVKDSKSDAQGNVDSSNDVKQSDVTEKPDTDSKT